jgi:excisionase family DNA binding protein
MQQLPRATSESERKHRSPREAPKPIAIPINETCRRGGFGRTMCYELIREGKLKTVALGRRRLVIFESLEALLRPDAV